MWLLSCEGDLLGGKKLWLRPGSAHLLGRTSSRHAENGERVRYIDHSTVSRKHLVLEIAAVQLGDSSRILSRSRITATDGSKSGTTINGEPLKKASRTLAGADEYSIRLGNLPTSFKLQWRPVVLTFNVGKSSKAKGTVLKEEKEKLEGADIKLTVEYVSGATTHVVAKKRNIPPGLQALLQAKWLVTDSFVNELADKCKRRGGDGMDDPGCSPLEDDFEANWPRELNYLTPAAGEPVQRPNEYLKPDPARATIFSNYTFVFLSQEQLDLLMPVIAAGGGKAVLCEYSPQETTVDDVVEFIKQIIGKKRAGRLLLSQEPGPAGVVIARMPERAGGRSDDFLASLAISLDQRSIEQSELLDAILMKDLTSFRLPLREDSQPASDRPMGPTLAEPSSVARPPPSSAVYSIGSTRQRNTVTVPGSPPADPEMSRSVQRPKSSNAQPDSLPDRLRRQPYKRTATARTNITFDDDFDPSQAVPDDDSSDEDAPPDQVSSVQAMEGVDGAGASQQAPSTHVASRKRSAPDEPLENDVDAAQKRHVQLMPTFARLKRQRTEAEARGERMAVDPTPERELGPESRPEIPATKVDNTKSTNEIGNEAANSKGNPTKKRGRQAPERDMQLLDKINARREAEEEARQRDEEDMQRDFDPKGYVPDIVEFEMPLRPVPAMAGRTSATDDRPEWRGRPNYKAFRSNKNRAGNRPAELERPPPIISLEPAAGKNHGLGDDYWLKRRKNKTSQSQSQHRQSGSALAIANGTVQLSDAEDEDDELAFRRRLLVSREEDAAAHVDADHDDDGPPQTLRGDGDDQKSKGQGKRPAARAGMDLSAPAPKRARPGTAHTTATRKKAFLGPGPESESEEDDPLAFKRKRR